MTKYARDEFDRVPETSTRQGVHRAVAASRRRSLAPILAAGCVALAIGLVAFLILPKLGFSAGQAAAVTAGGSASASPAAARPPRAPPAPVPRRQPESRPARTPPPSPAATPVSYATATAAAVDKTQPVTIYNATTTAGLANRVGGTVTSAGWVAGRDRQLGRRPAADVGDLLQRRRAEGQCGGPRNAPRHRHPRGLCRVQHARSSWCSAPASSRPIRLRLNNY